MAINFEALPRWVGVVGSREFPFLHWPEVAVRRMNVGTILVSGGARGVDKAAEDIAKERWEAGEFGAPRIYPVSDAEWRPAHLCGRVDYSAGNRRNTVLVDDLGDHAPSVLIAFSIPGTKRGRQGLSSGTYDVTNKARLKGIPYVIFLAAEGPGLIEVRMSTLFRPYWIDDGTPVVEVT